MCFIFFVFSIHFIYSTIKVSKYYFVFISFISIFEIILQFFKETPLIQLFPGAIPWTGITQRILSLEEVTLKDTKFSFESVSTSVIPSRPRWIRTSNTFGWLSPGEKKMVLSKYFFYGVFDHGWYEFQLKCW